jgi:hypothetical protein
MRFASQAVLATSGILLGVSIVARFWCCSAPAVRAAHVDQRKELSRLSSPDGRTDAILTRDSNCGATCPWRYSVYLVAHGGALPSDASWEQFGATHTAKLSLRWRDSRTLILAYDRAEIDAFNNKWYLNPEQSATGKEPAYIVEVRLAPTDSASLPSR